MIRYYMEWLQKIAKHQRLCCEMTVFLNNYGLSGLEQALQQYTDSQQQYLCNTRESLSKIRIGEIYYLSINGHEITIHTADCTYRKYGTLNRELKVLSPFGFMKCTQNHVVSLSKIKTISHNQITLINQKTIPMSRNYAPKVMIGFHNK